MREMKMHDPEAVCRLEYDQLQINGRSYVWSDGVQAVVRTEDNVVGITRVGFGSDKLRIYFNHSYFRLSMIQEQKTEMCQCLQQDPFLEHLLELDLVTAQYLVLVC